MIFTKRNDDLAVSVSTRIFEDVNYDIEKLMKKHRGRWTDKSHFIRSAIMYFVDDLKKR